MWICGCLSAKVIHWWVVWLAKICKAAHQVFTSPFQAPELNLDTVLWLLEELESITELGDLHSMELAKNSADIRKLHQEIKKNKWNISLIDSSQGIETEDRDFGKLQVNILSLLCLTKWMMGYKTPIVLGTALLRLPSVMSHLRLGSYNFQGGASNTFLIFFSHSFYKYDSTGTFLWMFF